MAHSFIAFIDPHPLQTSTLEGSVDPGEAGPHRRTHYIRGRPVKSSTTEVTAVNRQTEPGAVPMHCQGLT